MDCGLRPVGGVGAYAPEGLRIYGIATLYQLYWTEYLIRCWAFNVDGIVKSRILPFFWIPACAGMTISYLILDRYRSCHTREGGYPAVKMTFYDFINVRCSFFYLFFSQKII